MTALPKKIPKEIYVPTEGTIKAEFFGRFAGAESVFPADNSSVTRGDGSNFPFGKTRRIRINKSSMQTGKPNNVFVLSVISDLRFRQKSQRNST